LRLIQVLLALLVLGLFAIPAHAQEQSTPVVEAVEAKYAKVNVIQAEFVQKIESQVFGVEAQKGEMVIKRPAKMKWNFTSGDRQFITNGETMWVYNRLKKQVIRYADVSSTRSTADSLLQSLDNLRTHFDVEVADGAEAGHIIKLAPKKGDQAQFRSVHLTINKNLIIRKLVIKDAGDTVTTLDFSNVKLNAEVPDSTFEFELPKGVEMVEAGGR